MRNVRFWIGEQLLLLAHSRISCGQVFHKDLPFTFPALPTAADTSNFPYLPRQ
jgi:hypothetical protein